ncbi:MAG TPA: hypothetical protein VHP37_24345 [Burkholderiales bacterium]|nr:hypothetical protein [Burkholderiales bacterium]
MRCTLLIPRLFWPRETADAAAAGLELSALSTLLARATVERFDPVTTEGWLCRAFEVERQRDWPIAPLTLVLDGGEPDGAYWLRADPVHIKVSREGLHLVDSALFDLSAEEASAFVAALNAHFDGELVFCAPHPKRWYLKCASAPAIATHPVSQVAGKDVQQHLPHGEQALDWHRRFNEAQMLLHSHALNEAREDRGDPPVNSVWFWGGGTIPQVRGHHFGTVAADAAAATALAAAADVAVSPLHADAESWLACSSAASSTLPHLAVLDRLGSAVTYQDAGAWRDRIQALESEWFAPLLTALKRGRIDELDIVALGADHSARFSVSRGALFKVWRRPKPLAAYA